MFAHAGSAMLQLGIFSSSNPQLTLKERYIESYASQRELSGFPILPHFF
ncbi:MAG: hypothetical protein HGA97_11205 [Chlorobiaceae bacterium]|nr:hypothetical protein [Chlorobiaceae bacterium]